VNPGFVASLGGLHLESHGLKSMGCIVARFARAGEAKGEGKCPITS
jgi:hypothetical protein